MSETKIGDEMDKRIVIKTEDGRYLRRIDAWTGSPRVILDLTDEPEEALCYPTEKRADEDCEMLNGEIRKFGKIRRAVLARYGSLSFVRCVE